MCCKYVFRCCHNVLKLKGIFVQFHMYYFQCVIKVPGIYWWFHTLVECKNEWFAQALSLVAHGFVKAKDVGCKVVETCLFYSIAWRRAAAKCQAAA